MPTLLVAPDKFKGTATAREVCAAVASAASGRGWRVRRCPLADGGEGTLDAFGGGNRTTRVTGPAGRPVEAAWRWDDGLAVVEAAAANGLVLAGGAEGNDPERATTRGVGELIAAALAAGARRVLVGVGGSATTDGGLDAVEALVAARRTDLSAVEVASDVTTSFLDAARVYGPQKGADAATVERLTRRLEEVRVDYRRRFGVDPQDLAGSGAAGGLAGGLAVLGARIVPGLDRIAAELGLDAAMDGVDLVVTGEGHLDRTSFAGKVVGGVTSRAHRRGLPVVAVVGRADPGVPVPTGLVVLDLSARVGVDAAMADVRGSIERVVERYLEGLSPDG